MSTKTRTYPDLFEEEEIAKMIEDGTVVYGINGAGAWEHEEKMGAAFTHPTSGVELSICDEVDLHIVCAACRPLAEEEFKAEGFVPLERGAEYAAAHEAQFIATEPAPDDRGRPMWDMRIFLPYEYVEHAVCELCGHRAIGTLSA